MRRSAMVIRVIRFTGSYSEPPVNTDLIALITLKPYLLSSIKLSRIIRVISGSYQGHMRG